MFDFLKKKKVEVKEMDESSFDHDFRSCLIRLESLLHREESTEQIIIDTLKSACEFYDAEWCGIITTDTATKMWSAAIWYDAVEGAMAQTLFDEDEYFENYPRWVKAIETQEPVVIEDVAKLTDLTESEALHYKKLEVISVMGAPFGNRPQGFLIVKNPKKYKTNPDLLKMLAFVSMSTLYLQEVLLGMKNQYEDSVSEDMPENGIRINLFGVPELITPVGIFNATKYNAQNAWMILTYLTLHNKPIPSRNMAEVLWPDKDLDVATGSIRGIIYRFRKRMALTADVSILNSSDMGYALNPKIPFSCDVWEMDELCKKAHETGDLQTRINLLEKAVCLYKGTIYREVSDQEWLMGIATAYDAKYAKTLKELFEACAQSENYEKIHQIAMESIKVMPNNYETYYWMFKALEISGNQGLLRKQIDKLRVSLTEEEVKQLKNMFNIDDI